jgi:hypothetical protein
MSVCADPRQLSNGKSFFFIRKGVGLSLFTESVPRIHKEEFGKGSQNKNKIFSPSDIKLESVRHKIVIVNIKSDATRIRVIFSVKMVTPITFTPTFGVTVNADTLPI